MPYELIISPEAECDLAKAVQWINEQKPGLGREFIECVDVVFERIRKSPEVHAVVYQNARLTLVRRFPYVVCYLLERETVYVVAVFHGHRDPTSWMIRV